MTSDQDLNLVWLDIEDTNADALSASRMIQVAMLITDQDLTPLWLGKQRKGIRGDTRGAGSTRRTTTRVPEPASGSNSRGS